MQEAFKNLETSNLVEMLENHQVEYTKLMTAGSKEAFELCKTNIELLQNEINARKQDTAVTTPSVIDDPTPSDTDIAFTL